MKKPHVLVKPAFALALALMLPAAHVQAAEAEQAEPLFDVYEYVIEGNSLLPDAVLERTVAPYMGPGRRFADIEGARAALEKAYQEAGYLSVLVSLPNQRVDAGEVTLSVTEAPVERLTVSGAAHTRPSLIRESLPAVQPGQVPHFPSLQQEIANTQSANLQITPLVNATDAGDAIDVDLKIQDKAPYFGSIEFNNAQSYNTTRGRINATVGINNLFQLGHTLGLSWQYAPRRPDDTNTLSLLYGLPLGPKDDLLFTLTTSNSDTPTQVSGSGPDSTLTKGTFAGVRWTHRLPALNWPVRHSVFVGLDYKRNRDFSTFKDGEIVQRPPTRYPILSGGYNFTHNGAGDVLSTASASLRAVSSAMGGRTVDCDGLTLEQFDCKRAGASSHFAALQLAVGHARPVLGDWRLNLSADLQLATGALPSGEQYSLGGSSTVRGYYDFEQSGDEGWRTRAELVSPVWLEVAGIQATALTFVDRGFVRIVDPQPTQTARTHLGSYGLGLRFFASWGMTLSIDYARVVFDTVRPTDNGSVQFASGPKAGRDHRVDVSLQFSF
ncbi:ShlB/FhaC/HecB family hemolysin secretion/activation protein [Aquabacterium sp. A3]|uniref:ShlB/FhaC/HecB family hemolysin secretion/activation protein n=1 Tax=Aquabacterium sp. A3 TaxID=3132829 RepID=UPI00311A7811